MFNHGVKTMLKVNLTEKSQRVQDYLDHKSPQKWVVREQENTTATSQNAAEALGCSNAQIAKSIIFKTKGQNQNPILVIASGVNKVDTKVLKPKVGVVSIGDAKFTETETGYSPGGVPPVGHYKGNNPVSIKTFIDADLLTHKTIWAAAGTPNTVFELESKDLAELTGGEVMNLKLAPK